MFKPLTTNDDLVIYGIDNALVDGITGPENCWALLAWPNRRPTVCLRVSCTAPIKFKRHSLMETSFSEAVLGEGGVVVESD